MAIAAIVLAILSNSAYQYFAHKTIIKTLQNNQEILLARLRLLESTIFTLGLDKAAKKIQECEEVDKVIRENCYPLTITALEALPGCKVSSGCLTKDAETMLGIRKKSGPKPRLRSTEEMDNIINNILSDKKARGNTSATLFKKYRITKGTFYKYATKEQTDELMQMQTELRKKRNFGRGRK